jgi:hypothetical protein
VTLTACDGDGAGCGAPATCGSVQNGRPDEDVTPPAAQVRAERDGAGVRFVTDALDPQSGLSRVEVSVRRDGRVFDRCSCLSPDGGPGCERSACLSAFGGGARYCYACGSIGKINALFRQKEEY